ncbi:MAG: aldehyde dehydrogenase EutE [Candidatus Atribacteria bacterium]|nr:aldehyde dehydrogenase EutE [Candidatus Atribacteria bacterium]
MEIREADIRLIVERVLDSLGKDASQKEVTSARGEGIFSTVEEAVKAAQKAQKLLMGLPLDERRNLIRNIRKKAMQEIETLSRMAVEETGMGRVEDKIEKNRLAALKTPGVEDLEPAVFTDEHGMTLVERAPYGVIASIIPSTNPTSTVINNTISMVSAGNAVIFHPHPGAKKCSCWAVSLMNRAIVEAGGPEDVVCAIGNPTLESAQALMKHPDIRLLVVTGGPAVVRVAMGSGKKVIAAGPGNPPCVVDETADIAKAGHDIVCGAGFDNNIVCVCEKEILVVAEVADQLQEEMVRNGGFRLNKKQMEDVTRLVIDEPGGPGKEGKPRKEWVGKDARLIAQAIGLNVPERTRILFGEVEKEHPLVWTEQLLPVIPVVRFPSVEEAMHFAVECEHGFRHTAIMHSRNIANLSKMAKMMDCSVFVKNGPCYSGLGKGGAGFASFTIATPTGEGLTRARTFTRERRCTLVDYFRIV